jgi:hypothetical protein
LSDLSLRSCSAQLRTVRRIALRALSLAAGLNETPKVARRRRDSLGLKVYPRKSNFWAGYGEGEGDFLRAVAEAVL